MQVSHKEILQKEIEITKQSITDEDIQFIKENYVVSEESNNYTLYAYKIHQLSESMKKKVTSLQKRKIGHYTSSLGHTIPSYLIG